MFLTAFFKVAAQVGPYPNPEHDALQGEVPGASEHTWYHGTDYDPSTDRNRDEYDDGDPELRHDPGGTLSAPDRFEDEYGTHAGEHWNTDLGVHFASHPRTARAFATNKGSHETAPRFDSRIAMAHLHFKNPKVYASEHDMTEDAINVAHQHGLHYLSPEERESNPSLDEHLREGKVGYLHEHPDGEEHEERLGHLAGTDELSGYHMDAIDRGEGHNTPAHMKEIYLSKHPDRSAIIDAFRKHLADQGHDSIIYGNEHEAPIGAPSAIALHPHDQIHLKKWHWLHPSMESRNTEHEPSQFDDPADAPKLVERNYTPEHGYHWADDEGRKVSRLLRYFADAHIPEGMNHGIFSATKDTLDPVLWDSHEKLYPQVKTAIMDRLDASLSPVFPDWRKWCRVYFAGGEASYWWGGGRDFDTLIGVDYEAFRKAHPDHFGGSSDDAISQGITQHLRATYNADPYIAPWDGEAWSLTGYVNPGSWDIEKIKPYSAYRIDTDQWVVKPPKVKADWGPKDFGDAFWAQVNDWLQLIKDIETIPDPKERARRGAMVYELLHSDRRHAFGPSGMGWNDPSNALWKALEYEPSDPVKQLVQWVHENAENDAGLQAAAAAQHLHDWIDQNDQRYNDAWQGGHDGESISKGLWEYANHGFAGVNKRLRGDEVTHPEHAQETQQHLDNAFTHHAEGAPEDLVLHRYTHGDHWVPEEGESYKDNGFVSTSLDPQPASAFGGVHHVIHVPKGTPVLTNDAEQEVLLNRGTRFKVLKRTTQPNGIEEHHLQVTGARRQGYGFFKAPQWVNAQHEQELRAHLSEHHPDILDRFSTMDHRGLDLMHRAEHTHEGRGLGARGDRTVIPELADHQHDHSALIEPSTRLDDRLEAHAQGPKTGAFSSPEHPSMNAYRDGGMGGDEDKNVIGMVSTQFLRGMKGNSTDRVGIDRYKQALQSGEGFKDPVMVVHDGKTGRSYVGEGNHRVEAAHELGISHVPTRVVRGRISDEAKQWQESPEQGGRVREEEPKPSPWKGGLGEDYWPTDMHPKHLWPEHTLSDEPQPVTALRRFFGAASKPKKLPKRISAYDMLENPQHGDRIKTDIHNEGHFQFNGETGQWHEHVPYGGIKEKGWTPSQMQQKAYMGGLKSVDTPEGAAEGFTLKASERRAKERQRWHTTVHQRLDDQFLQANVGVGSAEGNWTQQTPREMFPERGVTKKDQGYNVSAQAATHYARALNNPHSQLLVKHEDGHTASLPTGEVEAGENPETVRTFLNSAHRALQAAQGSRVNPDEPVHFEVPRVYSEPSHVMAHIETGIVGRKPLLPGSGKYTIHVNPTTMDSNSDENLQGTKAKDALQEAVHSGHFAQGHSALNDEDHPVSSVLLHEMGHVDHMRRWHDSEDPAQDSNDEHLHQEMSGLSSKYAATNKFENYAENFTQHHARRWQRNKFPSFDRVHNPTIHDAVANTYAKTYHWPDERQSE